MSNGGVSNQSLSVDVPVPLLKSAATYWVGVPDCELNLPEFPWNQLVDPGPGWLLFWMNQPFGIRFGTLLKPSANEHGVAVGVGVGVAVGVGVGVPVGVGV